MYSTGCPLHSRRKRTGKDPEQALTTLHFFTHSCTVLGQRCLIFEAQTPHLKTCSCSISPSALLYCARPTCGHRRCPWHTKSKHSPPWWCPCGGLDLLPDAPAPPGKDMSVQPGTAQLCTTDGIESTPRPDTVAPLCIEHRVCVCVTH
eukprot:1157435-Pelagomonas_calceolata.AAC.4